MSKGGFDTKHFILIGVLFMSFFINAVAAASNKKIIVLGGGVIGVTSAYYLAEKGYDVTVIEQDNDLAKATSFANGAQLCYSCIYPLYPKSVFSTLLHFIQDLQLNYSFLNSPLFKKLENYLASKALNQELTEYRNNLFKESSIELRALVQKWNLQFSYQNDGVLQLFFNKKKFKQAQEDAEYKTKNGIKLTILSPAECLQREPTLQFTKKDIKGGILMEQDGTGDTYLFTKALAEVCKKLGVKFSLNTEIKEIRFDKSKITSLVTKDGEILAADGYVVSLAAQSKSLLEPLKIDLPLEPVKGYSITIELEEQDELPLTGIADPANGIFYARLGNSLRVAGLIEHAGMDVSLNPKKIQLLIKHADNLFPKLKIKEKDHAGKIHQWACLRPSSTTMVPLIVTSKYDNLFINTGQGGYGWTLAPASGKLLAELVEMKIE